MTSKRLTPLKDEPVTQLDELQELLAANIEAMEALNRNLCGHSDTKPVDTEALEKRIATVARNAVKELLEERQCGFEREEEEDRAQGKLTPQECYARMAADYADALEKYKLLCDAFGRTVKLTDFLNKTRDSYDTRVRLLDTKLDTVIERLEIHVAMAKRPVFPPCPKRLRNVPAFVFKHIPLYCLRRAYRSHHMRQFVWICLLCLWLLSVGITCFIAHDNTMLRKEIQKSIKYLPK
ncbi:hypothetical protein [Bacteroides clarus]|uniref:hypothetical protein n=1 Tax=Bacteroides clarus TaxID=626929 RepID=UPI0018999C99|nr:hypothetical protein [Bacteroides clarus]